MTPPKRLANGNLLVPARVEGPDGLIGDVIKEIGPDDPDYAAWSKWMDENPAKPDDEAGRR
jgi:hypothetical protein